MANLIKVLADIGEACLENEKQLKNTIYKYDNVKAFLCDIDTKRIEPCLNIDKEAFIVCRSGNSGSSPLLYPVAYYSDSASVVKDIMKGLKKMLSFFKNDEITANPILTKLSTIDESFFDSIRDQMDSLQIDKKEVGFLLLAIKISLFLLTLQKSLMTF